MIASKINVGDFVDGGTVAHKVDFTVADVAYVGFELHFAGQAWSVLYPADKELK